MSGRPGLPTWLISTWLATALAVPALSYAGHGADADGESGDSRATLADRLTGIRTRVVGLESNILSSLKSQKQAQANMRKIQKLIQLQRQERELGKKRLGELEAKVLELETRRGTLAEKIKKQQAEVRRSLVALERSASDGASGTRSLHLPEAEKLEAPRRKTLANLSDRGLKEVEALKVDLGDAEQLENRIQDEKQQLAYLFQDLQEQESILELNRQLQIDMIRKKHDERLAQLESYRRLKASETQVEQLIGQFNARLELERETETERQASRQLSSMTGQSNAFARLKGRLGLPVADGKVISAFRPELRSQVAAFHFQEGHRHRHGKKCRGPRDFDGQNRLLGRASRIWPGHDHRPRRAFLFDLRAPRRT